MEWTVFFCIVVCWFCVMIFCSTKAIHQTFNCFCRWLHWCARCYICMVRLSCETMSWCCWRSEPIPIGSRMERMGACVSVCGGRARKRHTQKAGERTSASTTDCHSSQLFGGSSGGCQEMAPLWPSTQSIDAISIVSNGLSNAIGLWAIDPRNLPLKNAVRSKWLANRAHQ